MKINPFQWRSDNIEAEGLRDGSVTIRVSIGRTYMGATIDMAEADDLGKFIIEQGIAQRRAEAELLRKAPAQPQEPISDDETVHGSLSDTHDGTHPHNTKGDA